MGGNAGTRAKTTFRNHYCSGLSRTSALTAFGKAEPSPEQELIAPVTQTVSPHAESNNQSANRARLFNHLVGVGEQCWRNAEAVGIKFFATTKAPRSSVSTAIFCANMTSPATRGALGTKHQPFRGLPAKSIS